MQFADPPTPPLGHMYRSGDISPRPLVLALHRPRVAQLDVVGANLRLQGEDQSPGHFNLDAVVLRQREDIVVGRDEVCLQACL